MVPAVSSCVLYGNLTCPIHVFFSSASFLPGAAQVGEFLRERADSDSADVVASAEKPNEAVLEEVKGNASRTVATEAAAAATTTAATTTAAAMAAAVAAAAVALTPAPVTPSAPESSRRRLSMSTWDEADLTPPLPTDVSIGGQPRMHRAWCWCLVSVLGAGAWFRPLYCTLAAMAGVVLVCRRESFREKGDRFTFGVHHEMRKAK